MADYAQNQYRATVIRWIDADTVELRVDLGQKVMIQGSYRLKGIQAPEIHLTQGVTVEEKAAGLALHARLAMEVPPGTEVGIRTAKADKYGRYLVQITLADGTDLAGWLLAEGVVAVYHGGPKPMWPWTRTDP